MAKGRQRFLALSVASLLVLLLLPSLPAAQTLQRSNLRLGGPFNDSYRDTLIALKDATINGGALQLTPDTRNNVSYLLNRSGRVLYPQPFKIWEERPTAPASNTSNTTVGSVMQRYVISFNTSFLFNVYRDPNRTAAEGLAFIIVADKISVPAGSEGGYLGLTNSTIDRSPANQLVAVEFDTVKQSYDPDNNHVGINVNSVVSIANRSLSELNITISPANEIKHLAWVDYDGTAKRMDVYVDIENRVKPQVPALSTLLDLGAHLAQHSYFGFAGSTGVSDYELNCILAWNLTIEVLPDRGNSGGGARDRFLKIGIPVLAVAVLALALVGLFFCLKARRRAKEDERMLAGKLKSLPGMPREFGYKELKKATGDFDEKNRLGQGGFGVVYRGVIPGEGTEVAVKLFSRETMHVDFLAELTIINRLRHKNLVRLQGWCYKNGKLLLVYAYMPNGSLDTHLYNRSPAAGPFPWNRRYKALADVASALHYLHNEYDQKVVHRDLKASNILLDADFNACLGDFGLARAIDNERTSYAEVELDGVPGTIGYVAPECFHTGKATRESDVFGFGAVILEVVCGRRPRDDIAGFRFLADWVWKLYREGSLLDAVDPQLKEYSAEEAERLLLLGLACSHPIPRDRPKTQAVVHIISGSMPPPDVPHFRPAFVWPSVEGDDGGITSLTATTTGSSVYASTAGWTPLYISNDSPDMSNLRR